MGHGQLVLAAAQLRNRRHLRALPRPVDAVLVTGDIADHGDLGEYEEAARILDAPFPVLPCPGNHDVRAAYRKGLLDGNDGEGPADTDTDTDTDTDIDPDAPVNRLHHIAGTAILMCDSTIPGRGEGRVGAATLRWITDSLDGLPHETPALLAFHEPPVDLHHPLPDSCRLEHPEDLAAVLAAYPRIVAVLTGHAHTAAASTFAGRPLLVGPAVSWTLRMPWEGEGAVDRDQPPGIAYHVLDDTHRLTTHYRVVL